ncbi:MAG: cell wall hydrolase [Allosphingosinicella sp.]|uniref:cell wall hydrolase n=1 Tax=Allosphingosinicella sp. TaxID=2823234 RepID=UPI003923EAD4
MVKLPVLRLPTFVRQHIWSWLVLATVAGLYMLAGISVAIDKSGPQVRGVAASAAVPAFRPGEAAAPPAPEPLAFKEVTPEDAVAWNASIPLSDTPNPAARPFVLAAASEADRLRAVECLTAAVYYEAAIEGADGQRAVAQVVLNRVRHPAYPSTVCGVVFEGAERRTGCQFTFTCDGALARTPHADLWAQAKRIAEEALAGKVYAPVGWSTHYHTNWVVPYWAANLVKAANVGTHIFYRWEGGWGRPPAFTGRHAGAEPAPAKMRGLTAAPAEQALAEAEAKDAAAATAAAQAQAALPQQPGAAAGAVDIAQRPIVRRYEPLRRETATAIITERAAGGADRLTASQRWMLTGEGTATTEPPLGRRAEHNEAAAQAGGR